MFRKSNCVYLLSRGNTRSICLTKKECIIIYCSTSWPATEIEEEKYIEWTCFHLLLFLFYHCMSLLSTSLHFFTGHSRWHFTNLRLVEEGRHSPHELVLAYREIKYSHVATVTLYPLPTLKQRNSKWLLWYSVSNKVKNCSKEFSSFLPFGCEPLEKFSTNFLTGFYSLDSKFTQKYM